MPNFRLYTTKFTHSNFADNLPEMTTMPADQVTENAATEMSNWTEGKKLMKYTKNTTWF